MSTFIAILISFIFGGTVGILIMAVISFNDASNKNKNKTIMNDDGAELINLQRFKDELFKYVVHKLAALHSNYNRAFSTSSKRNYKFKIEAFNDVLKFMQESEASK